MKLHFFLFLLCQDTGGKVSEGSIDTISDFIFLDKFCFDSGTGQLEYFSHPPPSLLLYYDIPEQWHRAYVELDSCTDRVNILKKAKYGPNGVVRLSPLGQNINSGNKCIYMKGPSNSTYQIVECSGAQTFRAVRSRWWFMAISTCDEEPAEFEGTRLDYRMVMTNGNPSDIFTYQFSFDRRYMLLITAIFGSVDGALFLAAYIVGWQLSQRRLHHSVYRIFTHCIFAKCIALVCYLIHFFVFAVNGIGMPTLEVCGHSITYGAEILFLLMLLVLSRGLNVTRMKLSKIELSIIAVYSIFLCCMYFALHVWQVQGFDPALVLFYSESLPGKIIACLKMVACGFVVISCMLTIKEAPAKRWFYTALIVFYTPWFFGSPVIIIVSNYVIDNWVREEVVYLVDNALTLYGYLIFIYLSWPSQANKNFPFHIRTTQVSDSFDPQVNYAASNDNERKPKPISTQNFFTITPPIQEETADTDVY